jgi:23S rRNA (guanosine2251-2'-O)-methyltransferase
MNDKKRAASASANAGEWIYGLHVVRAVLLRRPDRVRAIRAAATRDDPRLREIETLAAQNRIAVQRVNPEALRQQFGDVTHQGVAAEVSPPQMWNEDDLLTALQINATALLLVLDGVQDPHNLGACLRTADACGALAVIVPRDRAAQLTAVVRKVAAGAAETTPVVSVTNLARTLKLLKDAGVWIIGAATEAQQGASAADLKGPVALVLGAEGAGLRRLTRESCDALVRLPNLGAVESLNVSVAAGMLLYEAVRQRSS